jgi:hypothetical protein
MPDPVCARCAGPLQSPEVSGEWLCARHGVVEPLHPAVPADTHHLVDIASSTAVPLWLAWPLPRDWTVTGVRRTGGTGPGRAVAISYSGPGITARLAELIIVSEEPGTGLGAAYAGLRDPDPGPELAHAPYDTKVTASGQRTPLWSVPAEDCTAYVGEAAGCWLWALVWPVEEFLVVHDDLQLVDARRPEHRPHLEGLPTGALSPRLSRRPVG